MRIQELEAKALDIVERVQSGQIVEDPVVELKSVWPDDVNRTARQIGGHANAARWSHIIWLIGLDERRGVTGADRVEVSDWYAPIRSEFDGTPPELLLNPVIPIESDKTIVALLFDTSRTPYVVRNAVYGQRGGGSVNWEVPWREANSTRSARHTDLVRILVPQVNLPQLTVLDGDLYASSYLANKDSKEYRLRWNVTLQIYAETTSFEPLVVPFHRCEMHITVPGLLERMAATDLKLVAPRDVVYPTRELTRRYFSTPYHIPASRTLFSTNTDLIIGGPGAFTVKGNAGESPHVDTPTSEMADVNCRLMPIGSDKGLSVTVSLQHDPTYSLADDLPKSRAWKLQLSS